MLEEAESILPGPPRWFRFAAAAVLALAFLWFVAPGLSAGFTPDDIMNLHTAWLPTWPELLRQAAFPWLPGLRPVGGALYRASFDIFGFDLTLVRVMLAALLALNVWLAGRLAARLSGSAWAGWFAAALILYHVNFQALYWNTGACYDILAFTGTWGAALIALRARTEDVSTRLWLAAGAMFWLALGAKEIALALPAILLSFELLPGRRQFFPIAVASMLSLAFVAGRIYGGGGILATASYHPQFTPAAYAGSLAVMFGDLFYRPGLVGRTEAVVLLGALAGVAAATGSRGAWAAWCAFVFGALPVALIPPRGVYAWYVPLAALCMLLGCALARIPSPKSALWFLLTPALLAAHARAADRFPGFILEEQKAIAEVIRALPRSELSASAEERFFIAEDPFQGKPWGEWKAAMLIQLYAGRKDLVAASLAQAGAGQSVVPIVWREGRFQRAGGTIKPRDSNADSAPNRRH